MSSVPFKETGGVVGISRTSVHSKNRGSCWDIIMNTSVCVTDVFGGFVYMASISREGVRGSVSAPYSRAAVVVN